MNLDFTINKYRQLCDTLCRCGYTSSTVAAYLGNPNGEQKVIVIRHDVDRKPQQALRMARVEYELGIRSTYYFRFNKKVFQPQLIRKIAEMGHEIGYHYETLDKAKGNYERAIQIFKYELDEFRKVAEIKTICMHRNPLAKWDSRDLWSQYDFKKFGILGEAYLSLNNVIYLSDTGRTWEAKHKVKDWFPSDANNHAKKDGDIVVSSTDDITELIKKG